jgi:2-C-methyl-D-erythritol 2,4-cyclodiphosphate synthase
MMKVGFGYDIHPLVKGRPLILGGITIPFPRGLGGHSDADVLCHAVGDALLGAAGLGDLGTHFPDTDPKYLNASSIGILVRIREMVVEAGFRIGNVDSTVVTEAPRLLGLCPQMAKSMAKALSLEPSRVNVKAKTNEKFDTVGRGEAIVAFAVVLVHDELRCGRTGLE